MRKVLLANIIIALSFIALKANAQQNPSGANADMKLQTEKTIRFERKAFKKNVKKTKVFMGGTYYQLEAWSYLAKDTAMFSALVKELAEKPYSENTSYRSTVLGQNVLADKIVYATAAVRLIIVNEMSKRPKSESEEYKPLSPEEISKIRINFKEIEK